MLRRPSTWIAQWRYERDTIGVMGKRCIAHPRLWAPTALCEPRLLTPGQLDYPSGLIGQRQQRPASERCTIAVRVSGSCQQWERAIVGLLSEQPLMGAIVESRQAAGERYLDHLWSTHSPHFGSTRPAPGLVLTDELRADTLAQYLLELHLVKVRPDALSRHVLVHECCHAWTTPRHGPDFALGMLYLLEHELGCDRDTLLAKAHSMGLPMS